MKFLFASKKHSIFIVVFLLQFCILLWQNQVLSISEYELSQFQSEYFFGTLATFLLKIFGKFYFRLGLIFLHLLNCILVYKIAKNANFCLIAFCLSPGALASALILSPASLVVFCVLLCVYFEQKNFQFALYFLLIFCIFIDKTFILLELATLCWAMQTRNYFAFYLSIILILIGLNFYQFDFSGKPAGYFLDSLAVFAAVLTPPLFLHFFYTIYSFTIKKRFSFLYFLSAVPFFTGLLLSFRQKITIEEFLPFLLPAIILAVDDFCLSFNVHLPKFRRKHHIVRGFIFISLLLSHFLLLLNPLNYSNKHFASEYYLTKELAKELKNQQITALSPLSFRFKQLEFYGIKECSECMVLRPCESGEISLNYFYNQFQFCLRKE